MISYVHGNLFESPAQTLVNTVNTVGVMGKGIAKEFKRRYPEMFKRYREFCKNGELSTGKLYLYRTPNKWVLNFPTKQHWRSPSRIEWIEQGLKKFVDSYDSQGVTSISFPQLGCGNGGLRWEDVRPLMESSLTKLPIPVFIHVARPAANFVPEHEEDLLAARDGVTFATFVDDLRALPGVKMPEHIIMPAEPDEPLASVQICLRTKTIEVGLDDFESLWHTLRLRGAMPADEFPGELQVAGEELVELLTSLRYIRSLTFDARNGSNPSGRPHPGIRFAPPPLTTTHEAATPKA